MSERFSLFPWLSNEFRDKQISTGDQIGVVIDAMHNLNVLLKWYNFLPKYSNAKKQNTQFIYLKW